MYIEIGGDWMSKVIGEKDDEYLFQMYREITEFHESGVLCKGSELRKLSDDLRRRKKIPENFLRMTEDAVLYEMARRYYNQHI